MLRALIIRPSALGDTLLLTPSIHQIADTAKLTLLGRRPGIDFLRPFLLNCLDYEKGGWHALFLENPHCKDLPFPEVDRVISFLSDPGNLVKKALKICLKNTPIFSFPPFPPKKEKIHAALYLASCLKKSGLPVNPEEAIEEARRNSLLRKTKPSRSGNMLILHPGSGSKRKNYPPEFWLNLIRGKDLEIFHKKILLLGPAEEEQCQFFDKVLLGMEVEIAISPNKAKLLSLLEEASFYIGHDSGITHLAAMLGVPTVALFKNSHNLQWTPLGPDVTLITDAKSPEDIYKKIKERLTKV
jgi:heptosyltransferase-3